MVNVPVVTTFAMDEPETQPISALLTKNLIREAGRLNVPGRPFQYETTPDFLRVFGLQSLADLPPIEKVELSTNQAQLEISLEPQAADEQKETAQ